MLDLNTQARYRVDGWGDVAFRLLAPPDDGWVHAVMVGDDHIHLLEVSELQPLEDGDYCEGCGQIGCGHEASAPEPLYQIVRHYQHGHAGSVVHDTGLTLEQAQAHCRRADTHGDGWFDGYAEMGE